PPDDTPDVDLIGDQPCIGEHLASELHLSHAQSAPAAGLTQPGQEEACQLPHRVKAKAARHDRVTVEVAVEEPEVGPDVELRADDALAIRPPVGRDLGDPVEHEHWWQREARVSRAEDLAPSARQQLIPI